MDGQRFERELEARFRKAGIRASRPRQDRPVDIGDLHVADDIVVQAKAWKDMNGAIRMGLAGAEVQAKRAHRPIGVAIAKRSGRPIDEAMVAMPLRDFILLLNSREEKAPNS